MKVTLPGLRGNLYYAAFAANLASMAIGTHYSWSSPSLPKLQADDSWLHLDDNQASWVASLTALGTVLGPFIGGYLVNGVGRRWAIIAGVLISCVAWAVLLASSAVWHLYIGRFIGGVGGGIEFLACPMYVAEIAEPAVRGALGSLFAFFLVGGYLIEYALGPFVDYSWLILASLVPATLFFLLFPLAPESPLYQLRRDDSAGARESLTWLRPAWDTVQVQAELDEIQKEVRKSMEERPKISDLFATRGARMGLVLACGAVTGQQISGVNVVLFYAEKIFNMAGTSFSSSASTIIIGVILFVAGGFAPPLAKIFGIKNMLIASGLAMAVFQAALGTYFYLQKIGQDVSQLGWMPVSSMVGYIFFYTVGFGPLAWAVIAEVFPSKVKALASAIATSLCWLLGFILTRFFNDVAESLGAHFAFFLFAGCCVAAAIFTLAFLPDTRGMSLQQILDLLEGKSGARDRGRGVREAAGGEQNMGLDGS